jgi:hypothetical protein
MDNKVFSASGLPIRRSVELLPNIFQTTPNKKFLEAIVDPLIQPGSLEKLSGYVGRKYGKTYNPSDVYIDNQQTLRSKYQLEPGVVIKQDGKVTNFYDYIDFKNQIKFFDNTVDQDNRITTDEHYAWAPPVDWDKFVNYREYYWLPDGPLPVTVSGEQTIAVQTVYKVRTNGDFEWIFSPDGLKKNPDIKLYRGQTYYFEINAPGDAFCVRTSVLGGTADNYNFGVSNNGIENGVLTFTVPLDAPDVLYYQSATESDRRGSFRIYDIISTSAIDVVESIIGAKEFTSANGIVFTNGLKVNFSGTVTPEKYASGYWYVEGVGDFIRLLSIRDLELPILNTKNPEVLFDVDAFDTVPYDDATSYPAEKDYITINRSSVDNNSWSRYNRWFHRSVIDYSNTINNQSSTFSEDARAKRPIIEFQRDLQLFNHGTVAKQSVDFVDTVTTDVFSTIEGQANYNIDGVDLFEGARVLFTKDTDLLVSGKIYTVTFITTQTSPLYSTSTSQVNIDGVTVNQITGIGRQISLIETDDTLPQAGECVYIKRGTQKGNMFHYNGTSWILSQRKAAVQQAPLFDCFNSDGISFADTSVYPASTFAGSKLISYIVGTSSVTDTELGFKLSYLNIDNVGDIQFNFDFDNDTFSHQHDVVTSTVTIDVNTGFYKFTTNLVDSVSKNGWTRIDNNYIQPIIDSVDVTESASAFPITTCVWPEATREKFIVYVNGKLKKTGWTIAANPVNAKLRTLTFTTSLSAGDTITLKVFTDATPDTGYYEVPMGLEKNPLNLDLDTFTLGEITDHLGTIFEIDNRLTGVFPGNSNLKDISNIEMFGRRFVKHSGLMPVATTLLCDKDLNIIKSLRYAKSEYTKFKNNLIQLAVELPYDQDPIAMLDRVIEELSVGKNEYSAFFSSDMVGTGATNTITYTVEDTGIKVFALTSKFDLLTQTDIAVYVYVDGVQLLHGVDYTFESTFGFVRISKTLVEGNVIEIKEYLSTAYNYIPPTPTKLGLYKKFVPEIYTDTTYKTPQVVIRGHDGSITMSYGDFRDEVLLEFELRIYNNLKLEYDESILNIDQTFGGYYNSGLYNKSEVDSLIREDYLNWIADTDVDTVNNVYFDVNDSFTYTYSTMSNQEATAALPGYWRGVYNWFYDTDAPHLRPWEMQGFTIKPTWWESEYGAAPYTAGNLLLWEDIRDGIIRQGDRQNLKGEARYARPTILSHLPVDAEGVLLSPLTSSLASNFSLALANRPFVFGDGNPSETAWRKSSEYPFALMVALSLLTPCDFITKSFNRLAVKRNIIGQLVNTTTNKLLTNSDFAFSTTTGTTNLFGTVNYVVALLITQTKLPSVIANKLGNIEVKLSNRLSGFVDKSQFSYVLDSRTPQSASSSIYVPPENFEIVFNVSSPIQSVVYSGVVVEKRADGWKIYGYDKLNPTFKYYEALPTNADYLISVGGVSENFVVWAANKFYGKGMIVSYNNLYYRAKSNHTSGTDFDLTAWQIISKLPLVGATEALNRTYFDKDTVLEMQYGTVKTSIQEVADFIFGYGTYLIAQGIVFDGYNSDLQVARDWTTSVKEFLYWTSHNWDVGSIVTLSPAAEELEIKIPLGTVDSLLDSFYDYSILRSDGTKLSSVYLDVNRDYQTFALGTYNTADGIYFARVNFVVKEHVAIFDNRTVFNDVIYDPEPGYRQERIKIVGYRTIEWDGDYTSPGFLFDSAEVATWEPYTDYQLGDIVRFKDFYYTSQLFQQGTLDFNYDRWSKTDQLPVQGLVTNFDYRINQFDDYYDLDAAGVQTSQRNLARHAIGYQPRQYLENMAQDEISQYKLYQGFIREKGTANAITKIFDKLTRTDQPGIVLNEEWAFRVGNLGGVDQINEYEFKLNKADFRLNPQPVLLVNGIIPNTYVDNYIRLNDVNFTDYPGRFTNEIMPVETFEATGRSAGYVKSSDVDFVVKNRSEILTLNIANFINNSTVWVTFDEAPKFWTVLRYKLSNIIIDSVDKNSAGTLVTITTQQFHTFAAGDIIGINNVFNLTGFFTVDSATLTTIVVKFTGTGPVEILDSAFVPIGKFEEARFATTADLDQTTFAKLPTDSKIWIDQGGAGWEVLNRTKQYATSRIDGYDLTAASYLGTAVTYTESLDKVIASMPGSNTVGIFVEGTEELTPSQLLTTPEGFETAFDKKFGKTLATSPDGRWIVVGVPTASAVPSFYRGVYTPSTNYPAGAIIRSNGKLWRALVDLVGDASTLAIENSKVEPITLNTGSASAFAPDADFSYLNQGAIAIYENTENFGNYQGVWNAITPYSENDIVSRNGYYYKLVEAIPTARIITSTNEDPSNPYSTVTNPPESNPRLWQTVGAVNQWFFKNVVISPKPETNELFGSNISINGSGSDYWMTVSASGTGTVYLYRYVNSEWTQLEDNRYKGLYITQQFSTFEKDDVVFYNNNFYVATQFVPSGNLPTDANYWVIDPSYSAQGSLPTNAAVVDSEFADSTVRAGVGNGLTENVKVGDGFGNTTDISSSGNLLVVGAPRSNNQQFDSFMGVWNFYQAYTNGDVVRFNNAYYQLDSATSGPFTNSATVFNNDTKWTLVDDVSNTASGKVFIYARDADNVYSCIQIITSETLPDIIQPNENTNVLTISDLIKNNDNFGSQVKITADGTKLFITAPNADVNGQDKGRVFVFERILNTFKLVQTIFSPSDVYNEKFGSTISISKTGNTLVVGAINGRTKSATTYDTYTGKLYPNAEDELKYVNDPFSPRTITPTTYDLGTTTFFTTVGTTGTVWSYDYIDTQYVLGEEIVLDDITQGEAFGSAVVASDTIVAVGSPFYKNANVTTGRLFKFVRSKNAPSWYPYETQQPLVNIDLLSSLFLYNPVTNQKIADIDIIDPFKLKIVGIADQEIKYKTPYDPAIYSLGTSDSQVDSGIAWLDQHVGEVWWNVSTAKWPWYEQGNDAFRIGNWGKMAYGSSVDVYEWVESIYPPSTWATLSGTADGLSEGISGTPFNAEDTTFSFKQTVDSLTGLPSRTTYYYWVKNKLAAPTGVSRRQLSVYEIANLILSPELSGTPLIGLTSSQSLICYNIQPIISANTCIVNIQFDKQSRGKNLEHKEYQLLTEGVADSLPSHQLERKWIDSLIGFDTQGNAVPDSNLADSKKYGIAFRPRQSMFVNRQTALSVVIDSVNSILLTQPFADLIDFTNLELLDDIPAIKTRLYDIIVETEVDLTTIGTAKLRPAVLKANITNGSITSITVIDAGFGYKFPPKIEIRGNGTNATVEVNPALIDIDTGRLINPKGEITSVVVTNRGKKYTFASVVPRSYAALVATPSIPNSTWSIFTYDESLGKFYKSRAQAYNTTEYWNYIDWWMDGYSVNTRNHATIPALYAESELSLSDGQLVKVAEYGNGGWAVLERVSTGAEILGKYRLVGKQNGTIKIDPTIDNISNSQSGYDSGPYYDNTTYDDQPTVELRNIFTAIKEDIFVNDLRVEWNKLFFTSIHYLLSEQLYVDWVFKTSFLNAIHNVGNLEEKPTYQNDNLESYQEYVNEVKPYRSKVREFTSRYLSLDNTQTFTGDFDLPSAYNADTNKIEAVDQYSTLLTQYPWKAWADNNTYKIINLKISNGGGGYITPPIVNITGGGGTGATARTYIRAGKVAVIELLTPGSGYTSAPTVTLVGGNGNGSAGVAKAVAIIGQGVIRSMTVGVKFDRYSKTGRFTNTHVIETDLIGTGTKTVFELKYPPSSDRDFINVLINGTRLIRSEYAPIVYSAVVNSETVLKGRVIFVTAPSAGAVITIEYNKNIDTLDAINRLEYYKPVAGMLGNDASQLMTGIDFGGVIVQGTTFDVSGGWDALPWFTEGWDTTTPLLSDFYYVMPAKPTAINVIAAGGNTTRATLTFAAQLALPFAVGSYITVAGMDSVGYNGTYVVTACTLTTVTYFNATVGDSTGGTVVSLTGILQSSPPPENQLITAYKKSKITNVYTANGVTTTFALVATVDTPAVYVNADQKYLGTSATTSDYFIADSNIIFFTAPINGSTVTIETYNAPERLDDPHYGTPEQINANATMPTFVGDGSTSMIYIPDSVDYAENDIFIFRPAESDGSLAIIDKNLLDANVSGGIFGSYMTANGNTPDEIVIEGDSFISPDQVPAPEENIPGQVLESISIKVFHTDSSGSPEMITKVYTTDGSTTEFAIGQGVLEVGNVFVLLDKIKQQFTLDYVINFIDNTVIFDTAPAADQILEIKSIGLSGAGVLDYQEFIGDGATRYFLTKAPFALTNAVIATVNGVELPTQFSNSNGRVNKTDNTFVELGAAPAQGDVIKIVAVNSPTALTQIYSQEISLTIDQHTYTIANFVTDTGPVRSNVIVDIDGIALTPPDGTFAIYNGSNNVLGVGIDPDIPTYSIPLENITVYVNDVSLEYITQWSYEPTARTVTILSDNLSLGDKMLVEIANTSMYSLVANTIVLSEDLIFATGQKLNVTWFKNYKHLQLIRDVFTGGKYSYQLQTVPTGVSYIWVYVNGVALIQDLEFELDNLRSVIHLKDDTATTDVVQIITYGVTTRSEPLTFEIFKDMLNRHQFKRGVITQLRLERDLTYYDSTIQVNDATDLPARGIVVINSERIEYQTKNGDILGQLRRGIFGTAVAELHVRKSNVVNVSDSETLPYAETQSKDDFYGNGSTQLFGPLPFIPSKTVIANWTRNTIPTNYYQSNDIEVFVAGRRLIKTPVVLFDELNPTITRTVEAEFSVTGKVLMPNGVDVDPVSYQVRLTVAPAPGARVTVIQRRGNVWYTIGNNVPTSLTHDNTAVAKFIQERSSLLPSFITPLGNVLNTESGNTIDDETNDPIEF